MKRGAAIAESPASALNAPRAASRASRTRPARRSEHPLDARDPPRIRPPLIERHMLYGGMPWSY